MDKWRIFGAAVVCAAVLALAACTPGPGPVVTDSPSAGVSSEAPASPSPSPSLTGTAALLAQLPPDARYPDLAGAIKTAEFFLQQYAPMFQSGNTALWDSLSGPECAYCADASANATEVQKRGWVAQGGQIDPTVDALRSEVGDDGRAYIFMPAHLHEALLLKDNATPEVAEPASDQTFVIQLELKDGVWRVQGVKFEES